MNKWLPYVVAAVLGLGAAMFAFGPSAAEDDPNTRPAAVSAGSSEPVRTVQQVRSDLPPGSRHVRDDLTSAEVVADALANPAPPPGTLRPQNQGEIDHAARLARPYNKHLAHVSSFWRRAAQIVGATDTELSQACVDMSGYLREQGRLNDGEIDLATAIAKEQALASRVAAANIGNAELDDVLAYIQASSQTALDGGDPTTVPKPAPR